MAVFPRCPHKLTGNASEVCTVCRGLGEALGETTVSKTKLPTNVTLPAGRNVLPLGDDQPVIVPGNEDSGVSSMSQGLQVIKYILSRIEMHLRKFSIGICSPTSKTLCVCTF